MKIVHKLAVIAGGSDVVEISQASRLLKNSFKPRKKSVTVIFLFLSLLTLHEIEQDNKLVS